MLLEDLHQVLRKPDRTARPLCLQRHELEPLTLLPLECLPDAEHSVVQVDVIPAEPERLAAPEADAQSDGVHRVEPALARLPEELLGLLDGEGLNLRPLDCAQSNALRDIAQHQVFADRLSERGPEQGVKVLDRPGRRNLVAALPDRTASLLLPWVLVPLRPFGVVAL